MTGLLTLLIGWWLLHWMFPRSVGNPRPMITRFLKSLGRVITHLLYHRQAQRRGAGFGLLHAFAILGIIYSFFMIRDGSLTAWMNVSICWISFACCVQVYRKHQHYKRSRQRRHGLPRRHR